MHVTDQVDLLVCGAGPVGCVVAERCATQLGWRVLIVEKRRHTAGNCHDYEHPSGLLVHAYGPHYFRTNDDGLLAYLSNFTEWIPGNYIVKSMVGGRLYPFPINLTTLEMFFGESLDPQSAEAMLETKRVPIDEPRDCEEFVLSRVGREMYEAFYLDYTRKQWGLHPRELHPSVCGRIPIRFNRDERYVDHGSQVMPRDGYTAMFERMIDQPRIEVKLDTDYRDVRATIRPRFATVYTGPVDEYFETRLGKLPYRSLVFDLVEKEVEWEQPCVQINYPDQSTHTRSVEIKHVTAQEHPHTVISYETPSSVGDPYYPMPTVEAAALYGRYRDLAETEERERNVFFVGRLAQYKYMNSDEVMLEALACFERLKGLRPT